MSRTAVKYARVFWLEWRKLYEYRLNFVLSLLRIPIHVMMLLLVWVTIFQISGTQEIAGMTLPVFVMYIILARLCDYCQGQWTTYEYMEEHIKTGRIALFVTRPLHFTPYFLSQVSAGNVMSYFVVLLVLLLGNVTRLFGVNYIFPSALMFLLFAVSLFLAIFLGFLIYYCITLSMIWVGDVWSVWGIWEGINGLFSGQLIPLTVNPTFYTIANYLPFRHLVFTPVFIYLEKYTVAEALSQMVVQAGWMALFGILGLYILRKGFTRMDSQGG